MKTCKLIALTFVGIAAAAANAYEIPCGGDFAETRKDGFPAAWVWHDYPKYLPYAEAKVEARDGGNVLHYYGTRGENGSALRTRRRIPGTAGDIVTISFDARGSGQAWTSIYCWGQEGKSTHWVCAQTGREVPLSAGWERFSFTFTLTEAGSRKTTCFEAVLGLKPGADARFRNLKVTRRLMQEKLLESDDFEEDRARPGNPAIEHSDIAPGLLAPTGKGVYHTDGRVDIVPTASHLMPECGSFLTSGVRIYGFGKTGEGSLCTAFEGDGGDFFVKTGLEGGDVVCRLSGGRQMKLPETVLPADFIFSASTDGQYELVVTSLANSRTERMDGFSDFFRTATNGVKRTISLLSDGGHAAECTVDNVHLAVSRPERQTKLTYPYLAKPQIEFDPVKEGWPLVFSDEFEGSAIDGSKWDLSRKTAATHAHVENGMLRIKADYVPGSTNKLQTTGLWSVPTFLYGYFEARLKFTTYNGWWSAFWLCSHATGNPFVDGFEIDIFEDYYMRNPARNKLDHNLHIKGGGPLKSWNYNSILPGTHRDWYTIGCMWTPFEITYYLDGKAIASKAGHSPYSTVTFDAFRHGTCIKPLHAILSGQIMKVAYGKHDYDPAEKMPEYFDVDFVRVYGLPSAAPGASPEVSLSNPAERQFTVTPGVPLPFNVSVKPAAKTGAKIKAVHLFDDGYYIATKTEPPYEFVFPFTAEFFSRTSWAKPGRSGVRPEFEGAMHVFCAFAEDENGAVGFSPTVSLMAAPPELSRPFRGKAAEIPGVIAAGHYDEGGQGVAYADSTRGNLGSKDWRQDDWVDGGEHTVGSVNSGEWIRYTVDIKKSGRYRMKLMYGTPSLFAHTIDVLLDGDRLVTLGPLKRHAADHWGTDTPIAAEVTLPAGRHVLMLHLFGQFNFGDITFEEVAP